MAQKMILASGSAIRAEMLMQASLQIEVVPPRVDEATLTAALLDDGCSPRDLVDNLAEAKSLKIARKHPDALVIGSDQTLDLDGQVFQKPTSIEEARSQLSSLSGKKHKLHSAAVVCKNGAPVWRYVSTAVIDVRPLSRDWLDAYIERNWEEIQHCVGCYQLEKEGIRLIRKIEGDHFTVMGLPLFELMDWLVVTGSVES